MTHSSRPTRLGEGSPREPAPGRPADRPRVPGGDSRAQGRGAPRGGGGGVPPHPQGLRKNPGRRRRPAGLPPCTPCRTRRARLLSRQERRRPSRGQQAPGQRPEAQGRRGATLEWTGSLTLLLCFVLTQSCWLGPVGGRTQGQPAAKEAGVARMPTAGEGGVLRQQAAGAGGRAVRAPGLDPEG